MRCQWVAQRKDRNVQSLSQHKMKQGYCQKILQTSDHEGISPSNHKNQYFTRRNDTTHTHYSIKGWFRNKDAKRAPLKDHSSAIGRPLVGGAGGAGGILRVSRRPGRSQSVAG